MSISTMEVQEPVARSALNGESLYEVIDGCRVELPPMSILAVRTASTLFSRMDVYVDDHQLGRTVAEGLFILDARRDRRRRPDVAFVSKERWPLDKPLPPVGDWEVAPDLAVEVISRNDVFDEVIDKLHDYFRYDVRQVWLVLPTHRQVHVYKSPTSEHIVAGDDELSGGDSLPGFRLPLETLFRESILAEAAKT